MMGFLLLCGAAVVVMRIEVFLLAALPGVSFDCAVRLVLLGAAAGAVVGLVQRVAG